MFDKTYERAVYYSDGLKVVLWALLFSPVIILSSYFALQAIKERGATYSYVPLEYNGKPIDAEETFLYKPYYSDQEIAEWVEDCLFWSFSLDFKNYKRQLSQYLPQCYSTMGTRSVLGAMKEIEFFKTISNNSLSTEFRVTGDITVKHIEPIKGRYAWNVIVPSSVFYYGYKGYTPPEPGKFLVTVARASILEGGEPVRIVRILSL